MSFRICAIVAGLLLSILSNSEAPVAGKLSSSDRLGIEITTNSNPKPLYIPVALARERSIVAYVPVKEGLDVTAIRVEPVMDKGRVRFEASAVTGDYDQNKSCADVHKLPSRLIASFSARENEVVSINDNMQRTAWKVEVKAVKLRAPTLINAVRPSIGNVNAFQEPFNDSEGPCGCARCGTKNPLWCCPARGQCMECSNCGTVCCPNG